MTTIEAHAHIEADDNHPHVDLSVEDNASSTDSVTSSIYEFRKENGRTYHSFKDGKYNLPNDAEELERLDFQHNLMLLTLDNKLGLSPPCRPDSKVQRVLDLGTGTGIWATDFGDEHPAATVVGVDLSPVQPAFIPPNVQFVVDDIDQEWTYEKSFDFIHSRFMNFSIQSWKAYLTKIYDNLAPGGYVELQDVDVIMGSDDGTLKDGMAMHMWCRLLDQAAAKFNRCFERTSNFKDLLKEVGFADVVETRYKWPTNGWPKDKKYKELGLWNNVNASSALDALTMAPFTRGLGWSREEVEAFLVKLKSDWNNPKIHAYWPICVTYAKKPEA
ncbi:S-adenosyl-L-methionine-dependent methyltransferase [Fusarium flagelliforme]|uniref:S-adenosyl-L-methionine-dependent methyltransferase n=1 Tax=Fusarium flagelliforme TaxID=2675880 RepID=UPI001E8E305B|nr:S-adenosyl-L-methionine-dependent methyltransferase [Fusarium flagelliforme]KAH7183509.1 S-adenosyl-L-methionine-dependent methyltransferase [Fusarium flagelliforme]